MSYKVKQEDLIGDIAGFPIEVVQAMVDEQVRQGNKADVTVFQENNYAGSRGFYWYDSKERLDFWNDVIRYGKFDLFFKRYPKQQELVPEVEGVMMEVSDDGTEWVKRIVLCKCNGVYYTKDTLIYSYARPIQKPSHTFDLTDEQAVKIKSMLEMGEI